MKYSHLKFFGCIVGLVFGFHIGSNFFSKKDSEHFNVKNEVIEESRDKAHTHEDTQVQKDLYDEVRVLCWIMTGPKNHMTKAVHVLKTWGKRCNKLLIMSSVHDDNLDVVALPVKEGRNNLWAKTKEAFKYIYENHMDDADWFFKADDDTYTVVENLRSFLYPYDPAYPIYFGCRLKRADFSYMSGGAGYVLSKEAVKRFVEKALPDPKKCRQKPDGPEDMNMGKCLKNVGVKSGDGRDSKGRNLFLPMQLQTHMFPKHGGYDTWYYKQSFYPPKEGLNCCSDDTISFHYISPKQLYVMDYLIYHLQPYGIQPHFELKEKKIMDEMEKN